MRHVTATSARRLPVFAVVLALILAGALYYAQSSIAQRPNSGLAAGYFSAATSSMCSPSKRCDWYGLAHCYKWGPNSVACRRDAIDYRTPLRVRHDCHAWGVVDNAYRIVQRRQWCV